jgi:hypothetical protein
LDRPVKAAAAARFPSQQQQRFQVAAVLLSLVQLSSLGRDGLARLLR